MIHTFCNNWPVRQEHKKSRMSLNELSSSLEKECDHRFNFFGEGRGKEIRKISKQGRKEPA